jgi:hypothetical protein
VTDTPDSPTPDQGPTEPQTDRTQAERAADQSRSGDGKWARSLDTAKRDAAIAEDRSRSMSWRAIADKHGMAISSCHEAYHRALSEVITPAGEDARKTELEKLDRAEAKVLEVLERRHLTVSHGRVIRLAVDGEDGPGEPLEDDGPIMQAAATLIRISESRRKLLGLDAPAQVVTDSTVRYEVTGLDAAPDAPAGGEG